MRAGDSSKARLVIRTDWHCEELQESSFRRSTRLPTSLPPAPSSQPPPSPFANVVLSTSGCECRRQATRAALSFLGPLVSPAGRASLPTAVQSSADENQMTAIWLLCHAYVRQKRAVLGALLVLSVLTLVFLTAPLTYTSPLLVPVARHSLRLASYDDALDGSEAAVTPPTCEPRHHIMFLKTHKCASSSVQNVLLRYGYKHNLIFALPMAGNYLGNPYLFCASMIPSSLVPSDRKVDMFAVHTRLSLPEHNKVLHNDTVWITIVRHPAALYESLFNFFHLNRLYGMSLEKFVQQPLENLLALPRYSNKLGRNQMLFDMGFRDNLTVLEVRRAIDQVDSLFDLVLISEFMDESLILLRDLLCWTTDDVIFFTKNARRDEFKPKMSAQMESVLRDLNSADTLLYDHFVAKHRDLVRRYGAQRMADEVAQLRALRDEYYEDCGIRQVRGRDVTLKYKEYSGLVSAYVMNNNTDENCLLLSLPELPMLDTVRSHQKKLLANRGFR